MALTQAIFTFFLAILFSLPTNSCEAKKVNNNTKNPSPSPVNPDTRRVPEGKWGGQHVRLEVSTQGADFEFDCAHGRLDGPLTMSNGKFAATGTFVRERGHERADGKEDGQRVYFKGEVNGSQMKLSFSFASDGSSAETFTLTRGTEGRLFKCK